MSTIKKILFITGLLMPLLLVSCSKQDEWLSAKSDRNVTIPTTVTDFQALMDDTYTMNYVYLAAGNAGADNVYIPDASFDLATEKERNVYSWNQMVWPAGVSTEWNNIFKVIEIANVVLDGLEKIPATTAGFANTRGQALFYRAFCYYQLSQLFCKTYNPASAQNDLGVPIRLSSDVNIIVQRSSLKETYARIIADAMEAASLLPATQPYIQRPVNAAANALLAKTYLVMGDFVNACQQADLAIGLRPDLINYNNSSAITLSTTYRFNTYGRNNSEILFYASGTVYNAISSSTSSRGIVVPELYSQYDADDLRKTIFYTLSAGLPKFRGAYTGNGGNFCGLAINEVYMIRAECFARAGATAPAMDDLNRVLLNRYKTGTFIPRNVADPATALKMILSERRKELPFVSNVRWEDLKRLNLDPVFQVTLNRTIKGKLLTLPPNDKRYVLPIPDSEIQLSGLQQNER